MQHRTIRKRIIHYTLTIGFLFIVLHIHAHEYRNLLQKRLKTVELSSILLSDQEWIDFPNYEDRAAWNSLFGTHKEKIIQKGEELLSYQWQMITASDYLRYKRVEGAGQMVHDYDDNNHALQNLLLAELAEGKGRFVDQIMDGAFYMCEMTSWTITAHLEGMQKSKQVLPDASEDVLALASGDMGSILAYTVYFLQKPFDNRSPIIAKRIRSEVERRVVDCFLNNNHFWWMATNANENTSVNNWNPWCNFNTLQSALLISSKEKQLAVIKKSMQSVDAYLNYIKGDGACEEGPSYWGHAAGKLYQYLDLLQRATQNNMDLFSIPLIREIGEFIANAYIGNGWVVNFADASARGGGNAFLIYQYGTSIGSERMVNYASFLFRTKHPKPKVGRDLRAFIKSYAIYQDLSEESGTFSNYKNKWYPETQFCFMTNNKTFVAAKGGHNNESHNHNDVGSYVYFYNNTPVVIDVGVGPYTRKTFSSQRYSIWTMQSNYHNVPLINGVAQKAGAQYFASDVNFAPSKQIFSANLATAYAAKAGIKSYLRSIQTLKSGVKVTSKYELSETREAPKEHLMVTGKVTEADRGKIRIEKEGIVSILSYNVSKYSASIESITIDSEKIKKIWNNEISRIAITPKTNKRNNTITYKISTSERKQSHQ